MYNRSRITAGLTILLLLLFVAGCNQKEESQQPASGSSSKQAASSSENQKGKEVYDNVCHSCHSTGVAGAPKLGDQAAWKGRIAKGVDALVQSALNGKGKMPPKGGNRTLTETDIRAAVKYIVDQAR